MTTSHFRSELRLTPEQASSFASRLYEGVRKEVPAYGAISDPEVERDFAATNRRNVELFFKSLREDRMPVPGELAALEASARRRQHQGVPLEAIFHSYRVGVRVMWQCLLEVAPQQDHGHLAVLALDYADHVSRAAAQAYVEERQRAVQSRQDAARLLLTRIINSEAADDREVVFEASELGMDFTGPHIAVIVSGAHDQLRPSTQSDLVLAGIQSQLAEAVPAALVVLLSVGVVAVVPGDASVAAEEVIRAALTASGQNPAHSFAVGWGTPASGASRLAASYRAAVRAHALGAILQPEQLVHRYSELSLFDLFKEGQTMDAFVNEILRPLLELDSERRQRMADSLDAIFTAALNRKLAARRLGIHHNTLAHRIRRIEQLLGGSLRSGEFCFRVQLALRLLPLTEAARR